MSMLLQTKELLDQVNAFNDDQNHYLKNIVKAINFPTVNKRMKAVIAISQITAFSSQFRRNIALWDDATEVPINAISFVICGSGAG